jgi:hypothetical protein
MRSKIIVLFLLLLVQLGLAFALGMGSTSLKAFDPTEKLLSFTDSSLDRLVFEGGDKKILLQKQAGQWILPDHFGAPAAGPKIDDLLKSLNELNRPWPVAEKGTADKRFKVADDDFELRLTFSAGGKEQGRLYLGSSPGFRKIHARVGGEGTVYDIPFSSYQVSLKPEDWVDKGQLHLKKEEITSISLPDCRLVRQDKELVIEDLKESEQTVAQKVNELLDKVANLQILDVLGKAEQSLEESSASRLVVDLAEGRSRRYQFIPGVDAKDLHLRVSDQPYLYKVAPGLKDALSTYTRQLLVKPSEPEKSTRNDLPADSR